MSQENVAAVRSAYDAFKRGSVQMIFHLLDAEIEIYQSEGVPWGRIYKGHQEIASFFKKLNETSSSPRENVSVAKTMPMRKFSIVPPIPASGTTTEARGVNHTMAVASTATTKRPESAIHQAFRPGRWSPRVFHPSFEKP